MADEASVARSSLAALGRVGLVGVGNLGSTLTLALAARGANVVALASRHPERAAALAAGIPGCALYRAPAAVAAVADLVLLAVPDDAIADLDAAISWRPEQAVVHFSGARGTATLAHAAARGAGVAALHPLMIFPRPAPDAVTALARFSGCAWALEASDATVAGRLEALVAALDGHVVRLTGDERVPYHLAAVLASNYVVALLGAAVALWEGFGVDGRVALDALLPLLRATVANLDALGPSAALAGPVARGDLTTVAAHLAWLRQQDDGAATSAMLDRAALRAAYRDLARLAIPLARARGSLADDAAEALERLLEADEAQ
jgi:predicted short-subunit dehydrogenase-like oxidoreductase (DUF2520 family)